MSTPPAERTAAPAASDSQSTAAARTHALWITWEEHRRSRELAEAVGAQLHVLRNHSPRLVRYLVLGVRTVGILLAHRPRVVYCQNPSLFLASLLAAIRPWAGRYVLVVDRHSNFRLATQRSWAPLWVLFHRLSRYTIRKADVTIVTNTHLAELVRQWGGTPVVLQDPIPRWGEVPRVDLRGERNIVFVCTYSRDEPVREVIEAARRLPSNWAVYVTGRKSKLERFGLREADLPSNVVLTDFLADDAYRSLLASATAILVLTRVEYLLNCGCYEAVAVGRPLVASDTDTIRAYFDGGVVYTGLDPQALARSLTHAVEHEATLSHDIAQLHTRLRQAWRARFDELSATVRAKDNRYGTGS